MHLLLIVGICTLHVLGGDSLQLHSYYGDRMVLQMGGEGSFGSKIWGYGTLGMLQIFMRFGLLLEEKKILYH